MMFASASSRRRRSWIGAMASPRKRPTWTLTTKQDASQVRLAALIEVARRRAAEPVDLGLSGSVDATQASETDTLN